MAKRLRQMPNRTDPLRDETARQSCTCELCQLVRLSDRQFPDVLSDPARPVDDLPRFGRESQFRGKSAGRVLALPKEV